MKLKIDSIIEKVIAGLVVLFVSTFIGSEFFKKGIHILDWISISRVVLIALLIYYLLYQQSKQAKAIADLASKDILPMDRGFSTKAEVEEVKTSFKSLQAEDRESVRIIDQKVTLIRVDLDALRENTRPEKIGAIAAQKVIRFFEIRESPEIQNLLAGIQHFDEYKGIMSYDWEVGLQGVIGFIRAIVDPAKVFGKYYDEIKPVADQLYKEDYCIGSWNGVTYRCETAKPDYEAKAINLMKTLKLWQSELYT